MQKKKIAFYYEIKGGLLIAEICTFVATIVPARKKSNMYSVQNCNQPIFVANGWHSQYHSVNLPTS